jgi:Protein of unknown function (DUF3667)
MTDQATHAPPARCENCATALIGGYCHVCGQRTHNPLRHFGHAVEEVFESFWHLDGRIFRTLRDLFVPGRVAIGYLGGHRVRYVAPLRLFIILSLITFFVGKLTLHIDPASGLKVSAKPPESGIIVGDTRLDADHFSAAKSVDEVLAIRTRAIADIAAEERDSETGMILSTILDVAKEQIDARARQRMSDLGATPEQLDRLETNAEPLAPTGSDRAARSASASDDRSFVQRWLRGRIERMQANAELVQRNPDELIKRMLGALPGALFVLVPLFALCLKLLYIRSGRGYLEHLVIALYSHAFMLVALFFAFLLIGLQSMSGMPAWASTVSATAATALLSFFVPLYLLLMQKRAYAQGWLKTFPKYVIVGMIYSFLLGLGLFYAVLAGLSS